MRDVDRRRKEDTRRRGVSWPKEEKEEESVRGGLLDNPTLQAEQAVPERTNAKTSKEKSRKATQYNAVHNHSRNEELC